MVVWLPEELLDRIDGQREWRTTSEYIRNTLDRHVGKPKLDARPEVKSQAMIDRAEPEPQLTPAEFWAVARTIVADDAYWQRCLAAHDSEAHMISTQSAEPVFQEALAAHRAKKNPAKAG